MGAPFAFTDEGDPPALWRIRLRFYEEALAAARASLEAYAAVTEGDDVPPEVVEAIDRARRSLAELLAYAERPPHVVISPED